MVGLFGGHVVKEQVYSKNVTSMQNLCFFWSRRKIQYPFCVQKYPKDTPLKAQGNNLERLVEWPWTNAKYPKMKGDTKMLILGWR